MPRTKHVPWRCDGDDPAVREQQRAAAALAAAPHHDDVQIRGAGACGVTVKEEGTPEGQQLDQMALAPGAARKQASWPRAALAAVPAPTPTSHHDAPPGGAGAGASGVTSGVKIEEGAVETLAQQRDRLALALAHGPVRVDSHIKVEDTDEEDTDEEDTDEGQNGEEEEGPGGAGDEEEEEEEEEGPCEERGLALITGSAQVPVAERGRGGAPRRSTPADRAARAKRVRGDVAAADDVSDAPAPKRKSRGAHVGKSGRHGVYELTGRKLRKHTPWLKWCAELSMPGHKKLEIGHFSMVDDAARAYDAEVRQRGWAHMKLLNFPQPEELAADSQTGQRRTSEGCPSHSHRSRLPPPRAPRLCMAPRGSSCRSSALKSLARVGSSASSKFIPRSTRQHHGGQRCTCQSQKHCTL